MAVKAVECLFFSDQDGDMGVSVKLGYMVREGCWFVGMQSLATRKKFEMRTKTKQKSTIITNIWLEGFTLFYILLCYKHITRNECILRL